jgi:hypothetical protein
MRNHELVYRPLRAGIRIFNPAVNEPGTLGFLATAGGSDRWIVSCYHVLCGPGDGEPVYQPIDDPDCLVAVTDRARARADLDCAAARLAAGVGAISDILGVGPPALPVEPRRDMQVIKSGAVTGVTEGTIVDVQAGRVEIEPVGLPDGYLLNAAGDSGSLWVVKGTLEPVVLHQGGSATPRPFAYGIAVLEVLAALNLSMLPMTS